MDGCSPIDLNWTLTRPNTSGWQQGSYSQYLQHPTRQLEDQSSYLPKEHVTLAYFLTASSSSMTIFCKRLKTYLFRAAYNIASPPADWSWLYNVKHPEVLAYDGCYINSIIIIITSFQWPPAAHQGRWLTKQFQESIEDLSFPQIFQLTIYNHLH